MTQTALHFDDRLGTVLRFRPSGEAGARVQYRQLLDLLGMLPAEVAGAQIDAAFDRLAELGGVLAASERAALLGEPGLRLRSPRLVAVLAQAEPGPARAALARAELDEDEWRDLIPALQPASRALLRERRALSPPVAALLTRLGAYDRGLPPADVVAMPAPEGIGAIVRRIEAYRRARQELPIPANSDDPRLPLGEDRPATRRVQAFDFATDAAGRIVWADPGVAAMTLGLTLDDPALAIALRRRQPLRALRIELAGAPAIAGDWQVDAVPRFDPFGGRFTGYRGRMRRFAVDAGALPALPRADSEADRIRQLLHELRTPVNAIQGFAEVIQQQLFGPTPHEYRALAATIVGDAARMLAAFEELERLARLDGGAIEIEGGACDFAAIVEATAGQLAAHTAARSSGFALRRDADAPLAALAPAEGERIAWRLLATLAGTSAPGEVLPLAIEAGDRGVLLVAELPATLSARSDEELFHAGPGSVPQVIAAGVFGVGFALRLLAAEARAAGGKLERRDNRLELTLPGLTAPVPDHSPQAARQAG